MTGWMSFFFFLGDVLFTESLLLIGESDEVEW